ncbi:MAG: outer membrane beta-barrel protein [Bacteroidetes bacterium]|nr:outer membrane beta-barrel protein [Bacteroidota bacterium]
MKKLLIILFIVYNGVTAVNAQTNSKWSVGISFGVASPIGKFGDKNIFDSTAAFANAGPAINIDANYNLNKYVAFSLLLAGQQNSVDTKGMVSQFQKAIAGAFFNVSSGDWNIGKIMGGVRLSFPLDDKQKLNVSVRVMVGVLKTSFPKITITEVYYSDSLGNIAASQFSKDKVPLDWTFAWLAGAGLKYAITKRSFIQATCDYSASSPKVPYYPVGLRAFVPGVYGISGNPFPVVLPNNNLPRNYKQPVNSLNVCLGIGFNL